MEYIYGVAGGIIPYVILLLVIFLYFLFGSCTCCCCKNKEYQEANLILGIVHIVFCLLMIVGGILFFVMSGSLGNGLDEVTTVLPKVSDTLTTVYDTFNATIEGAIDVLDETISNAITVLTYAYGNITGTVDTAADAATRVTTNLGDAESYANTIVSKESEYDGKANQIVEYCPELEYQVNFARFGDSVKKMTDQLERVKSSIQSFKDASENMKSFGTSMNDNLGTIRSTIEEHVSTFKNGDILNILDPVIDANKSIDDVSQTVDDIVTPYKQYVKLAALLLAFLGFISAIAFGGFYFCSNGCARCCFNCYFPINIAWSFFGLLICAVFCFAFTFLYDVCDGIEDVTDGALGSMLGSDISVSDLLYCPEDKRDSIFRMAGLQDKINYASLVDNLKSNINGSIGENELTNDIMSKLENVSNVNVSSQLSDESLANYNKTDMIEKLGRLRKDNNNTCGEHVTEINNLIDQMETLINEMDTIYQNNVKTKVAAAADDGDISVNAAKKLGPLIETANNKSKTLVDDLTTGIIAVIDKGVNSLDCTLICKVFSPLKNTVCVYTVDSFAFGSVAFVILIIGLFLASFTVCHRRMHMNPNGGNNDDDTDNQKDQEAIDNEADL